MPISFAKLLNTRPDHYARAMRGGSLYGLMASNHGIINGIVGGLQGLMGLAILGGIGYAAKKKLE